MGLSRERWHGEGDGILLGGLSPAVGCRKLTGAESSLGCPQHGRPLHCVSPMPSRERVTSVARSQLVKDFVGLSLPEQEPGMPVQLRAVMDRGKATAEARWWAQVKLRPFHSTYGKPSCTHPVPGAGGSQGHFLTPPDTQSFACTAKTSCGHRFMWIPCALGAQGAFPACPSAPKDTVGAALPICLLLNGPGRKAALGLGLLFHITTAVGATLLEEKMIFS